MHFLGGMGRNAKHATSPVGQWTTAIRTGDGPIPAHAFSLPSRPGSGSSLGQVRNATDRKAAPRRGTGTHRGPLTVF
jgi:hypothetical protein